MKISENPKVSIIIPVYNEENYINQTIKSILLQDYTLGEIEIIIADGKSNDSTLSIIKNIKGNIKTITNSKKTMPAGFNICLSECTGEIIIMMGGHCKIESNFVSLSVENLINNKIGCVGGTIINNEKNFFQKVLSKALNSNFGVGGVKFRKTNDSKSFVDTVAFGAYNRGVFESLGGLDEELVRNQDDEFNFRMIQNNEKILLDPSIQSQYSTRDNNLNLFKQYFYYGFYKIRVMQKRRGVASIRHLIPGAFVMSVFFSLFIFLFSGIKWPIIMISALYTLSNIIATITTILKDTFTDNGLNNYLSKLSMILFLPAIFFNLHFSYGLGFILGFFKYWNKWSDTKVYDNNFNKIDFIIKTQLIEQKNE